MLSEAQARAAIAAVAFIVAVVIATVAWGQTALNVVLAVGWLWLLWDRTPLHHRTATSIARSGLALGKVEAVEAHLTGLESAGTGQAREGCRAVIYLDDGQQTHAIVVVALLVMWVGFVTVGGLWRQGRDQAREVGRLDADLDAVWRARQGLVLWARAPTAQPPSQPSVPVPLAEEPDTVVSHPADLFARKAALLDRYSHHGQHRR